MGLELLLEPTTNKKKKKSAVGNGTNTEFLYTKQQLFIFCQSTSTINKTNYFVRSTILQSKSDLHVKKKITVETKKSVFTQKRLNSQKEERRKNYLN